MHKILAIQCVSAALLIAPLVSGDEISFRVTGGGDACHEVHLPGWQTRKPTTNGCYYEFRGTSQSALFISVYCLDIGGRWDSPVKYGIDPERPRDVRRIDHTAWTGAADFHVEIGKAAPVPLLADGIEFGGHLLKKTGPEWRNRIISTLISPRQTRVALNSWAGKAGGPGPFEPGRIAADGKYWIDVYDVQSGHRLLLIQGEFHGGEYAFPGRFQDQAEWVTDRYFVLPLEPNGMRRLLVCDADAAANAADRNAERK